jgi:hypothetical protein
MVADEQKTERDEGHEEGSEDEIGRPPAEMRDERGGDLIEESLAERGAGGNSAENETPAMLDPAEHQDRHGQNGGGREPGAGKEAMEEIELPETVHPAHQEVADGHQRHADGHHAASSVGVDHPTEEGL